MPLFVCDKCGAVENSHCVRDKQSPPIRDYHGPIEDFYPNMYSMEMQGCGFEVEDDIYVNGEIWKAANEVRMLCSECNTGKWHDEFTKDYATDEEKEISTHSKCKMITPFDHDIELKKDDNAPHGYRLATEKEIAVKRNVGRFLAATTAAFPSVGGMLNKKSLRSNVIELTEHDK